MRADWPHGHARMRSPLGFPGDVEPRTAKRFGRLSVGGILGKLFIRKQSCDFHRDRAFVRSGLLKLILNLSWCAFES